MKERRKVTFVELLVTWFCIGIAVSRYKRLFHQNSDLAQYHSVHIGNYIAHLSCVSYRLDSEVFG